MPNIDEIITKYQNEINKDNKQRVMNLIKILENKNLKEFLKLSYWDYEGIISDKNLRKLINYYTNWLTNPYHYKDMICSNGFYQLLDENIIKDYNVWIEILKDNKKGYVDKIHIGSYNNKYKIDFNEVINNDIFLQLALTKLNNLNSLFKNIDLEKLDKTRYLNEQRYLSTLIKTDYKILQSIDKKWLNDKDIFKEFHYFIITLFKTEIINFIDKKLWWNSYDIQLLIKQDINFFKTFYNEIVNDNNLLITLIKNYCCYEIIRYLNNQDFEKVRDVIVNELNDLKEQVEQNW